MYPVLDLLKFISSEKEELNVTKDNLYALLYFAQVECFIRYNKPLFTEPILVTNNGIVINKPEFVKPQKTLMPNHKIMIRAVLNNVKDLTTDKMYEIIKSQTPYQETVKNNEKEISHALIRDYFSQPLIK